MTLLALWLSALLTGMLASGHCVLMCGSISGALQLRKHANAKQAGLRHQLGRVTSYSLAGAIAGGMGQGMSALDQAGQVRSVLQLLSAVLLLVIGIRLFAGSHALRWMDALERPGRWVWRRLQPIAARLARPGAGGPPQLREFGLGMLWGWLPCGMAYSMLLAAWMRADALAGAGLMAAFGLGTVPALFVVGWGVRGWGSARWIWLRRTGAATLVVLGGLSLVGLVAGAAQLPWLALSPLDCLH